MIKKEKGMVFVFLFILIELIFLSSFVNAEVQADPMLNNILGGMGSGFGTLFQQLFGANAIDDFLFSKILVFFLLFAVIYMILGRIALFEGTRAVRVVVTLVVSLLSIRSMPENEFITAILLPYGAMGASITIFLPMLIYFFFVHDSMPGSTGRRLAWITYGIIFLVFFLYRTDGAFFVGILQLLCIFFGCTAPAAANNELGSAQWIYWLGIMFVFLNLIFDRSIHAYFQYSDFERARSVIDDRARLQLLDDLDRARRVGSARDASRLERRARSLGYDIGF